MTPPPETSSLSHDELQQLVLKLLAENAEQGRLIAQLREEVARLKGLKGRPRIKPSGMETSASEKSANKDASVSIGVEN